MSTIIAVAMTGPVPAFSPSITCQPVGHPTPCYNLNNCGAKADCGLFGFPFLLTKKFSVNVSNPRIPLHSLFPRTTPGNNYCISERPERRHGVPQNSYFEEALIREYLQRGR